MESIRISGSGVVTGGEYDEIRTSGSAKIKGATKCKFLRATGSLSCDDDVDSKELRVSGSAKFDKNLKLEEGKSSGAIRIEGNLDAAKFEASGSIVVGGDVNVDEFSTKITNGSFENIYGDKIYINSDGTFASNFFHDVVKNIKVENIEATHICIKDVKADRVSGDTVCIEEGCKVNLVEYRKTLDISSKAKIGLIIKL